MGLLREDGAGPTPRYPVTRSDGGRVAALPMWQPRVGGADASGVIPTPTNPDTQVANKRGNERKKADTGRPYHPTDLRKVRG